MKVCIIRNTEVRLNPSVVKEMTLTQRNWHQFICILK